LSAAIVGLLASPPASVAAPAPVALSFDQLVVGSSRELKPSPRLLSLQGKRVKLTGFMAKMEMPPRGGFYLAPRPVTCDEAADGTADLPPNAVYVVVRSHAGEPVAFTPRPLEVTGVLDVGNRVEPDGRSTHIRITLDRTNDLHKPARVPENRP
jgi:hypothetical protein